VRIKNIGSIRIGHSFRKRLVHKPDGNVLVIQPRNIQTDNGITFGLNEPLRTMASAVKPLHRNDVLIVNRGRFAAAVFDRPGPDSWIVPSSILILTIMTPDVLPEYVVSYINSTAGQKQFRAHSELSTVPFIKPGNFGSMEITVPPLERQQSLAALDLVTAKYKHLSNHKESLLRQILNAELAADSQTKHGE